MEIINVDDVYKTVLSIVNKENRGYVAPYEFNRIAGVVQMSLIDKTFYDYNRALNDMKQYGVNDGYADIVRIAQEKLDFISKSDSVTFISGAATLPTDLYKLDSIYTIDGLDSIKFEEIPKNEISEILASPLAQPSADFPMYYSVGGEIRILPNTSPLNTSTATIDYIVNPDNPRWGFIESAEYNDYLYDPNDYQEGVLVVKNDAFDAIDVNISDGDDGEYTSVLADIVDEFSTSKGSATLNILVADNAVQVVDVVSSSASPFIAAGDVIEIDGTDLGGTGVIEITVQEENLYQNSTAGSIDFALHPMEEVNLVIGILAYAGVVIRDGDVTNLANQIAQTKEMNKAEM